MLIKIFFLSAYYRFVILYRPFSKLAPKIGTNRYETPANSANTDWQYIKKVAWAVPAVCNRTPWESKCLVQALVAKKILNSKNIKCRGKNRSWSINNICIRYKAGNSSWFPPDDIEALSLPC